MKAVASLTILGALASLAAAYINPIDPWGDSKWIPKNVVTIKWNDDPKSKPALSPEHVFDIYLGTGGDQQHIRLEPPVATNVKAGTTDSITYTVPTVDPPGKIYFLIFKQTAGPTDPSSNGQAYTTRFTITDPSGNPGTLVPTGPVGQNPGGNGTIVVGPPATSAAATGTATSPAKSPSPTADKPGSASSISGSAMSAAAALVAGAVAMAAF
ncbi:hypothetical protein BGX34_003945 [Mortierella sp. NVP85]|nr:hypothetical protein BGX34_003945 [Mortierella sp. NVP85]